MVKNQVGVGGYLGLAVLVALNLALFRGVMGLLTIPWIMALLVLLDIALARLLVWRGPLRRFEYGFIVTGFLATMTTLPYNNDPHILRAIVGLDRTITGDLGIFRLINKTSFIYAERATLGLVLLAIALGGGALAGWSARRSPRLSGLASIQAKSPDGVANRS